MNSANVHLFVFDTMADWEAAFAISAINSSQFQSEPGRHRVVTAAASLAPITTMGGVRIQPDVTLDAVTSESSAMLILPGGGAWEDGRNDGALRIASQLMASGVPVAAICGATLALARAGFLDKVRHTSNAREYLISSGYHGTGFYCGVPAVTDKNVITATGIAPVDFAREIFSKLNFYSPACLDAWYALFKYGDAEKYHAFAGGQA
ncbi:MAG TPA: DJ-1/PfpI family protein [Terracidiphilus sp.]|jgi:putative intracellular protease/amidase